MIAILEEDAINNRVMNDFREIIECPESLPKGVVEKLAPELGLTLDAWKRMLESKSFYDYLDAKFYGDLSIPERIISNIIEAYDER